MDQRLVTRILVVCLIVSLFGNVLMLLENRRLLNDWSPPDAATIQVHVLGAVVAPGVYDLPSGSRVSDALQSAGGLLAQAMPGQMNLAKPLFDGEQVRVPAASVSTPGPESFEPSVAVIPSSGVPDSGVQLVNVNTANAAELDTLPYIGPSKAEAIITYRQEHGAFASIEDLLEVPGIGEATLAKFKHLVTVK